MRIDAMNQVSQLYGAKASRRTDKAGSLSFSDSLEISSKGRDLQVAKAAVASAPDVREDRVAAIKAALANGTYSVSDEDLANKLLESFDI